MVLTPEIAAGILTAVKEEYRMICGMTYFQICLYFLFYSFGGWVVEVIFHAVTLGKVINRGFLNGPVCPVYGFGVLSVFALLNTLQSGGHQMSEGIIIAACKIILRKIVLIQGPISSGTSSILYPTTIRIIGVIAVVRMLSALR